MMLGFGFSKTRVFLPLCHMILRKFLNFSKLQSDDNNDIYSTAVVLGKTRETMCANCMPSLGSPLRETQDETEVVNLKDTRNISRQVRK